ncbi:MAG TPA: hypothetical protein PLM41_23065, partial [Saprospiraceae bacterium]|nr:hypothetical protein [Saprospiraceae bacterium]
MSPLALASERIEAALQENSSRLDLSRLGLNALPPNFAQIAPDLRTLNLWDNKFQSVPPELGLCTQLESLYFSQNELMTGYGLASFRQLTLLDLQSNRFTEFPPEVMELPLLKTLFLSKNNIARLPSGIRLLKELENLDLNDCQIETLPSEIAELPLLKDIKLNNNPLKSPPLEVALQGIGAIRAYFDDFTKNTTRAVSRKHLFNIVIEQYDAQYNYPPRPGALDECRDLAKVLAQKYDYQSITGVVNEEATRDAIFEGLENLCKTTAPEDCVIVYFNGWTGDGLPEGDLRSYDNAYIPLPEVFAKFSSMKAKHALLIVDNHLQSRLFSQTRGTGSERASFASRWALYRIGAEWDARFTPHLTNWLINNTLGEVSARELASVLTGVLASSLSIAGDEGGEFLIEPRAESNVGMPPMEPPAMEEPKEAEAEPPEPPESDKDQDFIFQIFIDGIKDKIADGESRTAIHELLEVVDAKSQIKGGLTLQANRLNDIYKQQESGIIDPSSSREINRVNYSILGSLSQLTRADLDLSKFSVKPNTKTRSEAEKESLDEITRLISDIEEL